MLAFVEPIKTSAKIKINAIGRIAAVGAFSSVIASLTAAFVTFKTEQRIGLTLID